MSIENNLKRIADALEIIATGFSKPVDALQGVGSPVAPTPAPTVAEVPTQPAPTVAEVPTQPAPVAPAQGEILLSDEEMNTALVAEFKRIGKREPIDDAMAAQGVTSVVGLTAEKQQSLLTAVRVIQA